MKGIIYCRVSSQEQVAGTSLENQRQACLEYAKNQNIDIEETFIEKGESATAANRTELIKVLEYCRLHKGEIGAFIVWKIDRFARNTIDHYALQAQLIKYGTTLHSVTEPIGDNPMGKMTEAMLAGYAQFENDIRKQRCEGGMQRKIKEGIWPWQPPIGYIHSKKITDRRKTKPDEPDPERFYILQRALKEYSKGGHSIEEITRLMNEWGFRTRTGKPMFKQLTERALRDKFYIGILVDPWSGKEYKGLHQPMITIEEYEKIQYFKGNYSGLRNAPRLRSNPEFPLRRHILCVCGHKFTGSFHKGRNKKYPYYECHNKKCDRNFKGIPKQELEKKFVELLKKLAPQAWFLRTFEAVILDHLREKQKGFVDLNSNYSRELKRLEERKERLTEMRINGEINKEEFISSKENLENQIAVLNISLNETKTDELDLETKLSYALQFMRDLQRQWQDMDVNDKQRLQKLIFPSGIIYDKNTKEFGTAEMSPIFELNRTFTGNKTHLVAPEGIEPPPPGYEPDMHTSTPRRVSRVFHLVTASI